MCWTAVINGTTVVNRCGVVPITAVINRRWPISPAWPIRITRTDVISIRVAPTTEPGTRANEDAAHKVVRSPISDGRASIGVIRVVAISANRLSTDGHSHRAYANSNCNLRIRMPRDKKQNS
jgi:hypothetical protein